MATRSAIGYLKTNGHGKSKTIRCVYCHCDGYPEHQLPILREHYNTVAKVRALLSPGSMSSLRTTHTWVRCDGQNAHPGMPPERDPQPLYHAERGENDGTPAVTHDFLDEAKNYWSHMGCEHLYLYVPHEGWQYYKL